MTKIEALTSIAQTVLRNRGNWDAPQLGDIANVVGECAHLVDANVTDENAAILELSKRSGLHVELTTVTLR